MRPTAPRLLTLLAALALPAAAQTPLAAPPPAGGDTRWSTPENSTGAPGGGNTRNWGATGHAWDAIPAHTALTLLDTTGHGRVDRIRFTLQDRSPAMLRALRIEIF